MMTNTSLLSLYFLGSGMNLQALITVHSGTWVFNCSGVALRKSCFTNKLCHAYSVMNRTGI